MRTASGSMSATENAGSLARTGDSARTGLWDGLRSGEPVLGIGLPRPSVVVAKVFSKPVVE